MPECTGLNGTRKGPGADCRQIGRFTNTGNWFAQVAKEEEKGFEYPKVNPAFILPELPECTGLNGTRKNGAGGVGTDCR